MGYCPKCGTEICPECRVCSWCVGHIDQPGDGEPLPTSSNAAALE